MAVLPSISIIICTSNRAEHLSQTLEALRGVDVPAGGCELLVVDNASTDNTAEVVQSCTLETMTVRYILEPRRGKGYAYNRGMAEALGAVFLFTDDDVRPPQDWITGMTGPILRGEAEAVAGGVRIASHLERDWMTKEHRGWLASTEWINTASPECMIGANMAFSRAVLAKVPGFDVDLGPGALGFYDETLFSWQLKEAGFRITGAMDLIVDHHFEASRLQKRNFLATAQKYGRSLAYVYHHWHHEPPGWYHDPPLLTLRQSLGAALRLFRWRVKNAGKWRQTEGMAEAEMLLLQRYWFVKYFRQEQRKPRKYTQYGLRKLSGE